jgi:hypothetical protein
VKIEITSNDTIWAQKSNSIIGCSALYDTLIVTANPPTVLQASANRSICLGDTTRLGGMPTASGALLPYSYAWSPKNSLDDSTSANPIAKPDQLTQYQVIVRAGTCKPDTASVTIDVYSLPVVEASRDTSIGAGESLSISASGAATLESLIPALRLPLFSRLKIPYIR